MRFCVVLLKDNMEIIELSSILSLQVPLILTYIPFDRRTHFITYKYNAFFIK